MTKYGDTRDYKDYIKKVTVELLESYGNILHKMPEIIHASDEIICDINMSIMASFIDFVAKSLEEIYSHKLGGKISRKEIIKVIFNTLLEE